MKEKMIFCAPNINESSYQKLKYNQINEVQNASCNEILRHVSI